MDIEKLTAPAGLCGYHRGAWKQLSSRGRHILARFAERKCRAGSPFCSWEWESGR